MAVTTPSRTSLGIWEPTGVDMSAGQQGPWS